MASLVGPGHRAGPYRAMGAKRTAWHFYFCLLLRRYAPRSFEIRDEVPLSEEPPRMDYLSLRRAGVTSEADQGETLIELWPLLPSVTIAELKTVLLLWLVAPQTQGAALVYERVVAPFLKSHAARLDPVFAGAERAIGGDAARTLKALSAKYGPKAAAAALEKAAAEVAAGSKPLLESVAGAVQAGSAKVAEAVAAH